MLIFCFFAVFLSMTGLYANNLKNGPDIYVNLLTVLFVFFLVLVYNEIAIYISASVKS